MIIVKIYCPELEEAMKEYPTLRMYMKDFSKGNGIFLSTCEGGRDADGKMHLFKDSFQFRNALLDWGFNCEAEYTGRDDEQGNPIFEKGDAGIFFEKNPKGFSWKYLKVVEI